MLQVGALSQAYQVKQFFKPAVKPGHLGTEHNFDLAALDGCPQGVISRPRLGSETARAHVIVCIYADELPALHGDILAGFLLLNGSAVAQAAPIPAKAGVNRAAHGRSLEDG